MTKEPSFIPSTLEELTPEFLTSALRQCRALETGSVRACRAEAIGEGRGFTCDVARVHLEYAETSEVGPSSLIAKLPSSVPSRRALMEQSLIYQREVYFYRDLAHHSALPLPRCYYAECDPGESPEQRAKRLRFVEGMPMWLLTVLARGARYMRPKGYRSLVLIEDLSPARDGDQIAGSSRAQTRLVLRGLAALHASYWQAGDLATRDLLNSWSDEARGHIATHRLWRRRFFRAHPAPPHVHEACRWVDRHCEQILSHLGSAPYTVVHGDYRLDNLLFKGDRFWAVDFGAVARGRPGLDLAYFVGSSVDRREPLSDLFDIYYEALAAHGIEGYSQADCERDYMLAILFEAYRQPANWVFGNDFGFGELLATTWRERVFSRTPPPPYDGLL